MSEVENMKATIADVSKATAEVLADDQFIGSGVLVGSNYILTAAHVVRDASSVNVRFQTEEQTAIVEHVDKKFDFALLRTPKPVSEITPLGYGVDIKAGDDCQIYGFPAMLDGMGAFFDARIQGTAPGSSDEPPALLVSSSQPFERGDYMGLSGAPVVVGNAVVGVLHQAVLGASGTTGFFKAVPISDIVAVLADESSKVFRIAPVPAPVGQDPTTVDVLVISALDEELDYLLDIDLGWSPPRVQADGITFRRGTLTDGVSIVATSAQGMGLVTTGIVSAISLKEWKPRLAAMIGICGGRKEKKTEIGDIVFAEQAFHYQYGAFVNGEIVRELKVENVKPQLLGIADHLSRKTNTLPQIQQSVARGFPAPNTLLQCHIGPIASADLVVKDRTKLAEAIDADRKTIAIDMESYAFLKAARLAETRWAAVMKSVTDFADAKKNDDCREYAKYTSAHFFLRFARTLLAGDMES